MTEKEITYNAAVLEIESILEKIEKQELDVDELAGQLKRVTELIKTCKRKLHRAESEVEKILKEIGD